MDADYSAKGVNFACRNTEMGICDRIDICIVEISRNDGTGSPKGDNPHPESKVHALTHDGTVITLSGAIMLYLTDLFADGGLAPKPGSAQLGDFLTWLFWYHGVVEPVMMMQVMGLKHPGLQRNFRGMPEITARLHNALAKGPWLCGERYTVADLICAPAFTFMPQLTPDDALIKGWVARCQARPALARAKA